MTFDSNSPSTDGQSNTADNANNRQNGDTLTARPPTPIPNNPPPPTERTETNNGHPDTPPWWRRISGQLLIDGALLVVGIVVASIYHGQLTQMIDSNKLNGEALYSVQRAFISSQKYTTELATYTTINGKPVKPITYIEVTAHWENVGSTPAIGVLTIFGSGQLNHEITEEEFLGKTTLTGKSLSTSAIPPKATLDSATLRQPLDWFSQIDPAQHWFYFGWLRYRDTFPNTKIHVTEFCWRVEEISWKVDSNGKHVGKPHFSGGTCDQHNCVDEFCDDYSKIASIPASN